MYFFFLPSRSKWMDVLDIWYGLGSKDWNVRVVYDMPVEQYERYTLENMPWEISSFTLNENMYLSDTNKIE